MFIKNFKLYNLDFELYPELILKKPILNSSIKRYTSDGYVEINRFHRGYKEYFSDNSRRLIIQDTKNIDEAIRIYYELIRKYNLDRSISLIRKINPKNKEDFNKLMDMFKSGLFVDKGYMSTSTSGSYILGSEITLEIYLTSLRYGAFLGGISTFKSENEFLIKREVPFEVIDIVKKEKEYKIKLRSL